MSGGIPDGYTETRLLDPFEIYTGPIYETGTGLARRYALRVREEHCNRRGVIHGGMLMTFADMTLGQAVWDATDKAPSVTMNMQNQFLKSAVAGDLIEVQPQLTRRTRSLVFLRGDFTVNGEIIFIANSIWKLLGQS